MNVTQKADKKSTIIQVSIIVQIVFIAIIILAL